MSHPIVRVESLTVDFWDQEKWVNVVDSVSFAIEAGETLGLAGESGCGKTTASYALFGYRRPGSRFRQGSVWFNGEDLLRLQDSELTSIRGARISLVPQNPSTSLTPSMRVGKQVTEIIEIHNMDCRPRTSEERAHRLFAEVGLSQPEDVAGRFPHQLSGGQQQRVIIAMALACNPSLLVLDEPTSALDVTTQARIIELLASLQSQYGMSMLYVTHDLGLLAQICDRVAVMYAGRLAEVAPTDELYHSPRHPYSQGLIAAVPRVSTPPDSDRQLQGLLRRDRLPAGCRFAPRCGYPVPDCFDRAPAMVTVSEGHDVACWRWKEIAERNGRDDA